MIELCKFMRRECFFSKTVKLCKRSGVNISDPAMPCPKIPQSKERRNMPDTMDAAKKEANPYEEELRV